MKKVILILVAGLLWCNVSFAESTLPPCQGEDDLQWTNCVGTYLNKTKFVGSKLINPDADGNKWSRDYTGEFGNTPGMREGRGSSITYKNGNLYATFIGEFKIGPDPRWLASKMSSHILN